MVTARDVDPQELLNALKEELKKMEEIQPPEWSKYVKTGVSRERPPEQEDWWYMRAAAVLRKIYLYGPLGTQRLRRMFGGKKNRGHKPEHFYPGSGSIIRKILQQLESAGLVKTKKKKGRMISPKGQKLLDNTAYKLVK
ncbi:MAG TPA: 30S ribosomal protein S19e [Candidatus Aenigmarchaeota archaeon]|nr:30S ribosomal protein S19e [Candidatus Aenigmarchaeota archaeon]